MAKSKASAPSNASAIRDALIGNPGKGPAEISALLKEKGVDVTPAYVSVVKSGMKKRKRRRRGAGAAAQGGQTARGGRQVDAVRAAAVFVKAVGGIDAAKSALTTVATIGEVLGTSSESQ